MENRTMIFCVVILIILLIAWQYFIHTSEMTQLKNMVFGNTSSVVQQDKQDKNIEVVVTPPTEPAPPPPVPPPNPLFELRDYDYRTLSDQLVPPYRRDDYNIPFPTEYTRGFPTGFKKVGLLIDESADNNDKYKFLVMMGRAKYRGSNTYDYYATTNNSDSYLKFDLPNLHTDIYTLDDVVVKELGKTYKFQRDRNLGFEYYPFAY